MTDLADKIAGLRADPALPPVVEEGAMTEDELLDGILTREGPGTPPYQDPADRGGRTAWGIDERSHPNAWLPGPPTRAQARAIYTTAYIAPFDALAQAGVDERVRVALIDDAVMSGVGMAIRTLQRIVGVAPDGVIGPATMTALTARCALNGRADGVLVALVQARAHRLAKIIEAHHDQARFVVGWIDRCLSFLG